MRVPLPHCILLAFAAAACAPRQPSVDPRTLHEKLLVLDSHLGTPAQFVRPGWNIAERHDVAGDMSQVDLPRMKDGGLDGGFWTIRTEQGPLTPAGYARARADAFNLLDRVGLAVAAHADAMALATTPADAARIAATGRRIVFQSITNSYPLGNDVAMLDDFYRRGVRMASLVDDDGNQFADGADGERRWAGLSPLGRIWVRRMNRLGMVIDASHLSDEAFDQIVTLSATPVILSHAGSRSSFDRPGNIDDARIRRLAAKGGVIQLSSALLARTNNTAERSALDALRSHIDGMTPAAQRDLAARYAALDRRLPLQDADFGTFMASLLHVLALVGPDHVGIGADWDGGGGVKDMADVAALPKITQRLLEAGYSERDIAGIWGGNMLRVLAAAQAAAIR